jgi:hypothetical protein
LRRGKVTSEHILTVKKAKKGHIACIQVEIRLLARVEPLKETHKKGMNCV